MGTVAVVVLMKDRGVVPGVRAVLAPRSDGRPVPRTLALAVGRIRCRGLGQQQMDRHAHPGSGSVHRRAEVTIYGKSDRYPHYRVSGYVGGKRGLNSHCSYEDALDATEKLVGEAASAVARGQADCSHSRGRLVYRFAPWRPGEVAVPHCDPLMRVCATAAGLRQNAGPGRIGPRNSGGESGI